MSITMTLIICANGYVAASVSTGRAIPPEAPAQFAAGASNVKGPARNQPARGYGALPVIFESNRGQVEDKRVKFISRNNGYTLFLTSDGAMLSLHPKLSGDDSRNLDNASKKSSVIRMNLAGVNRRARISGEDELAGKVNYIRGRDPRSWRTNIETYSRVSYRNIYRGVDLVYYGNGSQIEYDFVVAPGASPNAIRFTLQGGERLSLSSEGDLIMRASGGALALRKPILYQEVGGARREIQGGYELGKNGTVSFRVGRYDRTRPLVIDPVLVYSSFFAGDFDNTYENDIAVDAQGSAYVVGFTCSTDTFPTSPDAFRPTDVENDCETFVAKLTPDGSAFAYSTFLGPAFGRSIAIDSAGNAYVTGIAGRGFPIRNGFQTEPAEFIEAFPDGFVDAFIAKLNPTGSDLLYSSFLGGNDSDIGIGIALDSQGNAYVSGETSSTNFPITQGAARAARNGDNDSFVTKVNTNAVGAASLSYSTYTDAGRAIAVDSQGSAYVAGNEIVFKKQSVVKLNPSGTTVVFTHDVNGDAPDNTTRALWYVKDIAVDSSGSAYITGSTATASGAFPTTGGFQTVFGGGQLDAFLARLDATGANIIYSTYIGGGGNDVARGIAVDSAGNAYVTGNTTSQNFPTRDALQPRHNGGIPDGPNMVTFETGGPSDAFVAKVNTSASGQASLVFSTYYGFDRNETGNSIAIDAQGAAYIVGGLAPFGIPGIIHTPRGPAPALPGGISRSGDGGQFVLKIADASTGTMQLSQPAYNVDEAGLSARITVTRGGDTSVAASVDFVTFDGTASGRSDYTSTSGTLRFAAGETSKTFDVLITDDVIKEGEEIAGVALLNSSSGVALGAPISAALTISDNDAATGTSNPIDDAQFFVRQHYLDFLGREPDASGLNFWTGEITSCGADAQCREIKRINVSAAFFLSIEFQETGFFAIRAERVAFGRKSSDAFEHLSYRELIRAARKVGEGVVVGEAGANERLEANKQAYAESIAADSLFIKRFPTSLNAAEYVAALYASATVTPTEAERQAAISAYGSGGVEGRVAALRSVVDSASVRAAERDAAFVLLQYLGYLRRDPDQGGYNFWLGKLLANQGDFVKAEMVKAFITSGEYRQRFGQ
jgi:hypothetical protein